MPEEVPFRDYLDTCIKGLEDKIDSQAEFIKQHFALNELAIKKAEEAMLNRLEGMNEFRAQIREERGDYITKDTVKWLLAIIIVPIILAILALLKA